MSLNQNFVLLIKKKRVGVNFIRAAKEGLENSELFSGFGQEEITKEMISKAEKFLLKCVTKHNVNTSYEIRYVRVHFEFSIECFPSTSDSIRQQILRAYLQCYKRLQSPVLEDIELDSLQYGYQIDKKRKLFQLFLPNLQCPATSHTHIRAKSAVDLTATSVEYLI